MGHAHARGTRDERFARAVAEGRVTPSKLYQPPPPFPVTGFFEWLDSFLPSQKTARQIKRSSWSERSERRRKAKAVASV